MSPGLPRGPFRKYQQYLLYTLMEKREREREQERTGGPKDVALQCLTGPGEEPVHFPWEF